MVNGPLQTKIKNGWRNHRKVGFAQFYGSRYIETLMVKEYRRERAWLKQLHHFWVQTPPSEGARGKEGFWARLKGCPVFLAVPGRLLALALLLRCCC